jgi:type II secretory pathway component PulF
MIGNMKAVTHKDMAEFAHNMAKFMRGGLTLQNAFDAAAASTDNVAAGIVIRQLKQQLLQGSLLSQALSSSIGHVGGICAAVAEAGEKHGTPGLIEAFEGIALYQEKIQPQLHIDPDEERDLTVPTPLETSLFLRILRVLIAAQYGLYPALTLIATTQTNEPIRLLAARLLQEITNGSSLLDAMELYPDIFDSSARRVISLGDESRELMLVALDRAAEYKESLAMGLPEEIMIQDVATFLNRVATLMELKLSLNQALEEAAEDYTYNPVLRDLIVDINAKVEGGFRFSEACAAHPDYFDDQSVKALEAGEAVGSPENFVTLLRHIAERFERRAEEEAPEMPIFRTSVFISHSSHNRELVEELLIDPLKEAGISVWYAKEAIKSASEWERSILKGLEHCQWYLIAMSSEALESEWVKDELFWAIDNRNRRIVPVLLDDCDPAAFHIRMRRLQVIDFGSSPEVAQQQMFRALKREKS